MCLRGRPTSVFAATVVPNAADHSDLRHSRSGAGRALRARVRTRWTERQQGLYRGGAALRRRRVGARGRREGSAARAGGEAGQPGWRPPDRQSRAPHPDSEPRRRPGPARGAPAEGPPPTQVAEEDPANAGGEGAPPRGEGSTRAREGGTGAGHRRRVARPLEERSLSSGDCAKKEARVGTPQVRKDESFARDYNQGPLTATRRGQGKEDSMDEANSTSRRRRTEAMTFPRAWRWALVSLCAGIALPAVSLRAQPREPPPAIHPEFPIRGRENLSPPIVSRPIHQCALAVHVTGAVPHAEVTVF